ncbi:MFS transporter [Mycobacterium tilburgii]|uniref:MFS transporter n=1 Tax=Mycobacterium tilburgii TaxID=44467 RepID=UPI001642C0DE|nr:MFS transporter [Mycobacterium tilburgii]
MVVVVVVNALLGTYVVGLIPALLVAGRLSDRIGRKPVMLVGVLSALSGSSLLALGNFGLLLLAAERLLSGVGVGIAMTVGASWLTELSRPPFDLRAGEGREHDAPSSSSAAARPSALSSPEVSPNGARSPRSFRF